MSRINKVLSNINEATERFMVNSIAKKLTKQDLDSLTQEELEFAMRMAKINKAVNKDFFQGWALNSRLGKEFYELVISKVK